MTQQIHDDGFHEIQLNGKQLVFLFMAATVVSVVIFLCGVLVGRGVKAERLAAADAAPVNVTAETTPQQPATPAPTPAGSDPTAAAPPPAVDDLTYFNRLEKPRATAEQLKPTARNATPAPVAAAAPIASNKAEKSAKAEVRSAPAPAAASGDGYAVQIAAMNERGEAEAMAKRLVSKGYAAYVLAPAAGTPSMYRVRIGKFPTKREADTMAAKLQKEEQFKPWVTR
ncbi:MAG: SPOR domain-containing protein [Acidobacteria bacterium]|nr:SPOR domain-containing protein [Acidobacteriota bacterium]